MSANIQAIRSPLFVCIRGPPCTGKSTIAELLRDRFHHGASRPTAVIHTSVFYHGIVSGDNNYALVMRNTEVLVASYIRAGYDVILEGTLSKVENSGRPFVARIREAAEKAGARAHMFFLTASQAEACAREARRGRLTAHELKTLYQESMASGPCSDEFCISTSRKPVKRVLAQLIVALDMQGIRVAA